MTRKNLDYYRRRADEELSAAEQAGDPCISSIHREMARRYRELLIEQSDGKDGSLPQATGGAIAEPRPVFG